MNIPDQLRADPTFSAIYRATRLGMRETEHELMDAVISLAFSHGQIAGAQAVAAGMKAKEETRQ